MADDLRDRVQSFRTGVIVGMCLAWGVPAVVFGVFYVAWRIVNG
jgi:hypothetical protein